MTWQHPRLILLVIPLVFAVGCGGTPAEIATQGELLSRDALALQLSFNEPSGTQALDSSGNGYHGEVRGATRFVDSWQGRALRFDGTNDYVHVPENSGHSITGPMTLAAWVRTSDPISGPEPQQREILFRGGANVVFGFEKDRLYGEIYLRCYLRHSLVPLVYREVSIRDNDGAVRDGRWHHLAVVYRPNTTMHLYVDGVEVARRDHQLPSLLLTTGSNHYSIGGRLKGDGSVDRNLDGEIDDVRIYSRSLSGSEVSSLYMIRARPLIEGRAPYPTR